MRFEMLIAVHVIITLAAIAILHWFYTNFLGKKEQSTWVYMGVYSVYFISCLLPFLFVQNLWISGTATVASSVIVAFAYSGNPLKKMITAGIGVSYRFISEPLSAAIIMWISGHVFPQLPEHDLFYLIGVGLSAITYFIIIFALSFKHKPKNTQIKQRYQILLLLMVVVCCLLAYSDLIFIVSSGLPMSSLLMIKVVAVGAMAVFLYYVFERFQENAENEMISYMLESQMSEMRQQFEIIESHDNEIRMLKHDLNNQLIVLKQISETEQYAELNSLTDNLTGYIENATRLTVTGVSVLDAIIAIKKARAEQQNTKFIVIANIVQKIIINPVHLNVVIGNALDNALEACLRLTEQERRYIELALKTEGNHLYIRVTNSAQPIKNQLNGLPISSKRRGVQKGYGLESIRRMINEYNGMFRIDTTENEFILTLRIRNTVC